MMNRLRKWLEHPRFPVAVTLVSVLLMAGSLNNGWFLDDHIQRMMLSTSDNLPWIHAAPFDLYRLIPSDDRFIASAQQMGFSPWWGADSYQAIFFRPLSSLTLYLDHVLWPDSAAMAHLHSLLWFVLLCVSAVLLFRKLMPTPLTVALAAGLYILDDAHIFPAVWVANRNSLIATCLSFFTLWMHIHWQKEKWRPGAFLSPFSLAVSLLAGEFALGICGFLFAHVLFLESGTHRRKLLRMLPYVLVVLLWRGVYVWMGYGVWGSDLYIDPLLSPGAFADAVLLRLPILLQAGFGWPGAEGFALISDWQWLVSVVSLAIAGGYLAALRPLLRSRPQARFFFTGTVLSLLPACATFAHDRLLLIAAVGIFGLIALFTEPFFQSNTPSCFPVGRFAKIMAGYWLLVHGVANPLGTPIKTEVPQFLSEMNDAAVDSLPNRIGGQTIVIVTAPDLFSSAFVPLWRQALGRSVPAHTVALYNGDREISLIRETDQSLIFEVSSGQLGVWTDQLVRCAADPFDVGQVIDRAGVRFQVLKVTADGNPIRVRAVFSESLDAPLITFWYWAGRTYRPFSVPKRGEKSKIRINVFDFLFE